MQLHQNENTLDRLIRVFLAELFLLLGYYWTGGILQIVLYVLTAVMLFTAITGFCALYLICKCNTKTKFPKPLSKKILLPLVILLVIYPFVAGYYSDFFTRKFFLEDFNRMNNFYKQTLFNTGQDNRIESVDNYEKLVNEYTRFSTKYQAYHPAALKRDKQLNSDLQSVGNLIAEAKNQVYNGDLKSLHTKFEEVRPVFQSILKRNKFSMLGVTLVDFHDSMEKSIAAADAKNAEAVIKTYIEVDEKLKAVEAEANDDEIKAIRKNLEDLLALAKEGKTEELSKKAAELKSSFVKVYLKRG
jgi:hypothetical protein